jgi:hypothetical protein
MENVTMPHTPIEIQTAMRLGNLADTCRQLAPDLRYCADQADQAARLIEDQRWKAAEETLVRFTAAFDRVLEAMTDAA